MLLIIFTTIGLVFSGRSAGCLEGDCQRKKVHKKWTSKFVSSRKLP